MTARQLADCSRQAIAILELFDSAAWQIQNESGCADNFADAISQGQKLAVELLEPLVAALEVHEGMKEGKGMTYPAIAAGLVLAFAFGFLLGDRRGVKQANEVLDHNNRLLLRVIGDSVRAPVEGEDEQRPVLQ
ncbi:hypothetical protein [Mesorhizobium sp. CN2-181]|uniref:hypothetical protein n=1 Tax=Mesorhizobium yinganensis TaxID=3157707 RepID=UPI0032B86CFE